MLPQVGIGGPSAGTAVLSVEKEYYRIGETMPSNDLRITGDAYCVGQPRLS